MINATPRIEELFKSVQITLDNLKELEKTYKNSKEKYNNELVLYIKELAILSDRKSIRADVLRELYWNKGIAVGLLQDAFGMTPGSIRRLAGPQAIEFPCAGNCGNSVKIVVTSTFSFASEDYYKNSPYYNTCDDCKKKDEPNIEQDSINKLKQIALRQRRKTKH